MKHGLNYLKKDGICPLYKSLAVQSTSVCLKPALGA